MADQIDHRKYQGHYSEGSFWRKLGRRSRAVGRGLAEMALQLYYVIKDSDAPLQAKGVAIGALGYLILPADLIPDFIPAIGFTDDAAAVAAALYTLSRHVTDEIRGRAREKAGGWFG